MYVYLSSATRKVLTVLHDSTADGPGKAYEWETVYDFSITP